MTSIPTAVLRTVPWAPVVGMTAGASALFGVAIMLRHNPIGGLFVVLAIGSGAAGAAFLLDEPALDIADATPTSRGRRAVWRVAVAPIPAVLLVVALGILDGLDPQTHWTRLWVVASAGVLVGLGAAAALKRAGRTAPGELAAVVTFGVVVLLATANPLQHWAAGLPLGTGAAASRGALMWLGVGALGAAATALLERDPGR